MTISDDEDENLAQYLESEVLSEVSDQEQAKAEEELEEVERLPKRLRLVEDHDEENPDVSTENCIGFFSKIPPELSHRILKFLSSEDLVSCSLVCRFLNYAASDESLWRHL